MGDFDTLFSPGNGLNLHEIIDAVEFTDEECSEISPSASPDSSVGKAQAWLKAMQTSTAIPNDITNADIIGWVQGFLHLKKLEAVAALPATLTPAALPAVRLVQIDCPCCEFPQMLDLNVQGQKPISASQHDHASWLKEVAANPNATWVQTKTKFTRIVVELQNADGKPVKGTDVQPGGLKLQLTMHKLIGPEEESLLTDADNSRDKKLFAGTAGGYYNTEVKMLETRNEFRFKTMCLSNDVQKSAFWLQVTPTDPEYADREELIVRTKSFMTRAADKAYLDKPGAKAKAETGTKRARAEGKAPSPPSKMQLTPSLAVDAEEYRNCEGMLKFEYDQPTYRGAFDEDDDDDDDDDEDAAEPEEQVDFDEEAAVPEDARISNPAARAALRRLLADAESGKRPSGKQLAEALLACRVSS